MIYYVFKILVKIINMPVCSLLKVTDAFITCGRTLQEKLSICNPFPKAAASIDPDVRGHSVTLAFLHKLPRYIPNVLSDEEMEKYHLEVRKYQTASLPDFEDNTRIDHWWGKSEVVEKYPCLSSIVHTLLSCFHGPQVEAPFNMMNAILDNKSGRMNMQTYNAIQK